LPCSLGPFSETFQDLIAEQKYINFAVRVIYFLDVCVILNLPTVITHVIVLLRSMKNLIAKKLVRMIYYYTFAAVVGGLLVVEYPVMCIIDNLFYCIYIHVNLEYGTEQ
jgi:hypothetical protein